MNGDEKRYLEEKLDSGYLDNLLTNEGEETVTLTFSSEDIPFLADSLRRRFIQVKGGRFNVLRASVVVKKALE